MDQQLLQRTRYLLQTRFRKIRTAPRGSFELVTKQVLDWLEAHPIIGSVIQHLNQVQGNHQEEIQLLLNSKINGSRYFHLTVRHDLKGDEEPEFRGYTPITLEQHASACLLILRATIQRPDLSFYNVLAVYLTQEEYDYRSKRDKDALEVVKDIAAHDLYEYLDEALDGINAVNGLLRKYKQNVEWFQRERIQQIITDGYGGKSGERALALHLQQYIFDQSVEFVVEPSSTSGEVDVLLRDPSGQYSIIDAKLVQPETSPSKAARKIAEGFNQVARYCSDYNEAEGFLAVFVNDDISILVDIEQDGVFRFFKVGGYVIYYIEINVAQRASASKSGKAKQIYIPKEILIEKLEELQQEASS